MSHLTKTEMSHHMAEYCHNNCSKYPPFAHTCVKTFTPLVNCTVNDGLVNAMPNMQKMLLKFATLV